MIGKILLWLQEHIKHWTKPATSVLIIGLLSDLTRSHADLVVENALFRQQLNVFATRIYLHRGFNNQGDSINRSSSCEGGSYLIACAWSILLKMIIPRIAVCISKK